ncbi:Trophinin [Anabarilius grahami]|uniref:Trophinin n=1 Tax=Anabarilius grahami TaxID=495550 RepID=A0A3N0YD11_ANAGA|nr:Trophinin [Anabarilius grahami]
MFSDLRKTLTFLSQSEEQTVLGMQTGPQTSAGMQARPLSSAGVQAGPSSSAWMQARPLSSAEMQAGPLSSAGVQARPPSSAGKQARPLSSTAKQVGPLSSAGVQARPQSSAEMQAGPLSSAEMQAGPLSSAGVQARPPSSAGKQARPLSSTAKQVGPLSSAGVQARPQSSAEMQAGPLSSAEMQVGPLSSAGVQARPQSSAGAKPTPRSSVDAKLATRSSAEMQAGSSSSVGAKPAPQSSSSIKCALCSEDVDVEGFTEHLSDYHVQECCDQCGAKVWGAVGLLHHIENHHLLISLADRGRKSVDQPASSTTTSFAQSPAYIEAQQGAPQSVPHTPSPGINLRPPEVNWVSFLPKQFCRVIKPADQKWIAQCLYDSTGRLKQQFSQNWFHPPSPSKPTTSPPDPSSYLRQWMFLWAPMRMWGIPLKCTQCKKKMHHSGIYTKVREVIDIDSKYYLVGADYPRCSNCMIPVCPWKLQGTAPVHSEEWARWTIDYLTDCEVHQKRCALTQSEVFYQQPPPFCPLPLAQWFETVHANEILTHIDELKCVITSTYGSILKLDSTKKITKKLAGGIADTATWMTNVGNEIGQVLNCVLTTGEGAGLDDLCQGIVKQYKDAGEPEPAVIYVDRDCCSETGWRCNAVHTQMYMLEGASRWNINRGRQAVDMGGTSLTKIYDVRLMSHMNDLSNRVLGCRLLPECIPPGKPTLFQVVALTVLILKTFPALGPAHQLRLFMTHGQAAQRPDVNRVSECVALKLLKEFREARNRPKDNKGKTFPIPQAIVMTYSHIKQLLEDCRELLDQTNLVLVTINNTTVSSCIGRPFHRANRLQLHRTLRDGRPFRRANSHQLHRTLRIGLPFHRANSHQLHRTLRIGVHLEKAAQNMTKTGKSSAYWNDVCHRYAQGTFQFSTGKRPGSRKWKEALERIDACPLQRGNKVDLFGRHIECTCGFHKSTDKAGGNSEEAGTSQGEQGVKCSLCGVVVEAKKFSEHLSDHHAEERCDTCGARVRGAVGLLQHIESNHYGALLAPRVSPSKNPMPSPCPSPSPRLAPPPQHLPSPLPAPVSPSPQPTPSTRHSPAPQPSPPPPLWPAPSPRPTPFPGPGPSIRTPLSSSTALTTTTTMARSIPMAQSIPTPLASSTALTTTTMAHSVPAAQSIPTPLYSSTALTTTPLSISIPTPPLPQAATDWESFLPSQFKRVLQPADWVWIAKCLYVPTGQLRQKIQENWFYPPMQPKPSPPGPGCYFRQRMFLWAPMRMWGIPLKCSECGCKMHHSGIYSKVREVIDMDSRHYLVGGDYPCCSVCRLPVCPWSQDIISQLDVAHRTLFPAVLTTQLALDRKCVTFLRPRTSGNSSSYLQSAVEEVHSEEWAQRTIQYLSDCEKHLRKVALVQSETAPSFSAPAPFRPLPLAQWFETIYSNDILSHLDEMKGVITSTYGRILKMDSTKK